MKLKLAAAAVVLVALGVAGWIWRTELKARYYTHRLMTAVGGDADAWIAQAGGWGEAVPERLLDCLAASDAAACERAGAALMQLEPRSVTKLFAERLSRLSPTGQQIALNCATALVAGRQEEVVAECRQIVRSALQQSDAGVRLRGAALAMRPEIGEAELLVPLLKDPAAEIRRTAMVAVGPSRSLIADDDLLYWLHDPDSDVRRLAEAALRSRGLRPAEVHLGRLLTDPRPTIRLELLVRLSNENTLDLSAWLRRLSEDPSPAVRAASARVIEERQVIQLTDRLLEMAQSDPDMTVRQTVGFHLLRLQTSVRPVAAP